MVTPFLIVTPATDGVEFGLVVMQIELIDLQILFQRALNTWADVPPYILALSDKLEKL